jgi:hypothetical protein
MKNSEDSANFSYPLGDFRGAVETSHGVFSTRFHSNGLLIALSPTLSTTILFSSFPFRLFQPLPPLTLTVTKVPRLGVHREKDAQLTNPTTGSTGTCDAQGIPLNTGGAFSLDG